MLTRRVLKSPVSRYPVMDSTIAGLTAQYGQPYLWDFMSSGAMPPEMSFTRASVANYFNSAGLLTQAASGAPRFSYNPDTLAPRGLLVEKASTNLLVYSRDLTQANWIKVNMTTAKTATGLDGVANSATTITAGAANATILHTVTAAASSRTLSVYLKRRTGTGTVDLTQNGVAFTAVTVTASWQRFELNASILNATVGIRLGTNTDALDVDGAQFEAGTFPTSRITTAGATASRVVDLPIFSTLAQLGFNAAEGTIIVEWEPSTAIAASNNGKRVLQFDDGTDNNVMTLAISNGTTQNVQAIITNSGSSTTSTNGSVVTANTVSKEALAYKSTSNEGAVAGATLGGAGFNALATIPTVNRLRIGDNVAATRNMNGWLRRIAYWPSRLPDATLRSLTA